LGVAAPRVVGGDDFLEVGIGQIAVDAVDKGAEFAGIHKQRLLPAVAALFALIPVPSPTGRRVADRPG